jgi:hypothetical protein
VHLKTIPEGLASGAVAATQLTVEVCVSKPSRFHTSTQRKVVITEDADILVGLPPEAATGSKRRFATEKLDPVPRRHPAIVL